VIGLRSLAVELLGRLESALGQSRRYSAKSFSFFAFVIGIRRARGSIERAYIVQFLCAIHRDLVADPRLSQPDVGNRDLS
jgi:hypothetical protein